MTREFFNQQFAALANAYVMAQKLPDETQDVYWTMLQKIPEDKFAAGVRHCLANCKFFPTIAELGNASIPKVKQLAPYNPYVYTEPRTLDWQEQIEQQERKQDRLEAKNILKQLDHKKMEAQ